MILLNNELSKLFAIITGAADKLVAATFVFLLLHFYK